MEAPRAARERTAPDTTLSRKLADFLVEFSIALHKRSIYPVGHPYLRSSADRFADRVTTLLESREAISIGVARDRLVIESATTDPANALLRDLSHRLHRHQLASIGFTSGIELVEIESLLAALGDDPERERGPLGRRLDAAREWPHVQLRAAGYDRLTLHEPGDEPGGRGGDGPARDFWLAFAQAALADEADAAAGPPPADDEELIVTATDREARDAAYDSVVLGYLSQVAEERSGRAGVGEAKLRRRVSRLLRGLDPETARRLLETGAELLQREQPLLAASQMAAVDAVAEVLEAAAKSPHRTISHNLLGLLHKLALQVPATGVARIEPDGALRKNVARLISGWELDDPNPGEYTAALQGMVREMPVVGTHQGNAGCDPEVVLRTAVQVDGVGPAVVVAADALVASGNIVLLGEILDAAPDGVPARELWPAIATEERLRDALEPAAPDHRVVAVLASHLGVPAADALLDALERAATRSNRAALLKHVVALGPGAAPATAARLEGAPWYLQRNILVLLGQWGVWPEGFSPLPYASSGDVRVRREAMKLLLADETHRPAAIVSALADRDDTIVGLGLGAAVHGCPAAALPMVRQLAESPGRLPAIRGEAVRVLARSGGEDAVEVLVGVACAKRRWLRRPLAPRSPAMLAAIEGLACRWPGDPRAAAVLREAQRHRDLRVRAAAKGQA
ncbi:MAG TPA: HEAT repeat domain-containing protein [Gemmatimonadales bacterium]|jgi:hypothetical protein|nr:HEAT repeat domain-containing protein [Gemmatimonadales bacterium]